MFTGGRRFSRGATAARSSAAEPGAIARRFSLGRRWSLAAALACALPLCWAATAAASPVATSVTKLEPSTGPVGGGTSVTITGTGFTGATAVEFGSRPALSFEVQSSTEIVAVSPPWVEGNAIAEVTVTTPAATSVLSGGDSFIYEPVVSKVEPSSGPAAGGTKVTITGEAFEGGFTNGSGEMPPFIRSVRFGRTKATSFKLESEDTIVAESPPGTGSADVTVTTFGGTSATSSADRFSYLGSLPTGPPVIDGESVSHITPTDATLEAQINAEGLETSYQFRLESGCLWPRECAVIVVYPLPNGKLLGSFVDQGVSLDLNSAGVALSPGVEYAFSVTATNAAGSVTGREQRFTAPQDGVQPKSTAPPGNGSLSSGPGSQTGSTTITSSKGASPSFGARHHHKHHHKRQHHHKRGPHHRRGHHAHKPARHRKSHG
jgi:hypothetical protein